MVGQLGGTMRHEWLLSANVKQCNMVLLFIFLLILILRKQYCTHLNISPLIFQVQRPQQSL
jgi:hypothetical protein